ncbi:aminopeptidase N [Enterovirga sp. GCM10030262]|uniref:aminopeptidase N n=1 Tax=Enterovirga sp. GCM10030262 TaxID=3273391 RepID=UPI0036106368
MVKHPKSTPAIPPSAARLVRREDYRTPDWLVPEIALDFDLAPDRVRVRARIEVRRNGDHRAPLRLDGDGLKLVSLKVDGKAASHKLDRNGLTIRLGADSATVETLVEIVPGAEQSGLFDLGGLLCTQCEPEGFRRITFFPDRPDVLARYRIRIAADKALYPILLSNGDPVGGGDIDGGRHWAEWNDSVSKPCYLFALVAGALAANRDRFTTRSGKEVDLAIWTRAPDLAPTAHALASLKAAMAWDETAYGREYDLDAFNIVALPSFAFGAMENKGLAIFDSGLILANPESATDADLDSVGALVAHEYFHNWSGNRVTCRDWFELALKEGFTVFRDQQFSADRGSAAVKRIEDVRALRAAQFPEDAGPRAHPVRPESYRDPADLHTSTVYAKGAELVRMIHTIVGPEDFRAGAELYFDRHDGQAVTCEDFIAAMEEASGRGLGDFVHWYAQVGTPRVRATLGHDADAKRAVLTLEQDTSPPVPIPLRVALFGEGGKLAERLAMLEGARQDFVFEGIGERPVLSINRGFSAPVLIEAPRSAADLAFLSAQDDDPFARWEAVQNAMAATLLDAVEGRGSDPASVIEAVGRILEDRRLEPGLVAEMARLPSQSSIGDRMALADPGAIHLAWRRLRAELGRALEPAWRAAHGAVAAAGPDGKGARQLRSVALDYLLAGGGRDAGALALGQLAGAETPTDREGALRALADSDARERPEGLAAYHRNHRHHPVLLDRWFSAQALSVRDDVIETAPRLLAHPDFTLAHPTRLGALVGAFAANPHAFHDPSGRGYRFLADVVLAADRLNPRASAGLAPPLTRWRRLEPARAALMKAELERIHAATTISDALRVLVSHGLAGTSTAPGD